MGMFMRTSAGVAIAQKVYSAATAFATMVQNSLNISFATFLALTGVGIAVIIAAAAAMYSFANSMNSATSSVQNFNSASAETPTSTRSIQRAGEQELYRRGVE
jgi:ABC-type lipoprotein release transport system permease subunit